MIINTSVVVIFAFSPMVNWVIVVVLGVGGMVGGYVGSWLNLRLPEKILRGLVVLIGVILTIWLFVRA
jgi:uncharacterized membrane protein YfcA